MRNVDNCNESEEHRLCKERYERWREQRMRLHPGLRTPPRTGILRALEEGVGFGQEMLATDQNLQLDEQLPFLFFISRPGIQAIQNTVTVGRDLLGFFSNEASETQDSCQSKARTDRPYRRPGI